MRQLEVQVSHNFDACLASIPLLALQSTLHYWLLALQSTLHYWRFKASGREDILCAVRNIKQSQTECAQISLMIRVLGAFGHGNLKYQMKIHNLKGRGIKILK